MAIFQKIKDLKNTPSSFAFFPFKNSLQPYLILFFVSFGIYLNTFNHEIAFDDESAMLKNEYVIKGIRGIPGILTHDSYYSYYKQLGISNGLPGGRYRPLSQITFAIEQEFIGTIPDGVITNQSWDVNQNGQKDQPEDVNEDGLYNDYDFMIRGAGIRHAVNVILYILLILLLYHFLKNYLFPNARDMIFLAVIFFAVHPLHTEVVANIKSRDEILSLLFITLTLLFSFRYLTSRSIKDLFLTSIFMLLALMSKEYALVLFLLIPATIYIFQKNKISIHEGNFWILIALTAVAAISFIKFFNSGTLIAVPILYSYGGYYFARSSRFPITKIVYMLGIALAIYLGMRFSATIHDITIESFEKDILANPYLYAESTQIIPSKIAAWLKYIELFFVPKNLLVDYSYSTIPYSTVLSPDFWLSIVFFGGIIIWCLFLFFKRSQWALP